MHPKKKKKKKKEEEETLCFSIHTTLYDITGRSLHTQVEHHMRDNFATLILYGIDNFEFCDIFFTYT